ncbi:hypothetical protein CF319_g522 [Tilletia indica]|nr:hypothetical protein CF319_g522 [Tilletia indica]
MPPKRPAEDAPSADPKRPRPSAPTNNSSGGATALRAPPTTTATTTPSAPPTRSAAQIAAELAAVRARINATLAAKGISIPSTSRAGASAVPARPPLPPTNGANATPPPPPPPSGGAQPPPPPPPRTAQGRAKPATVPASYAPTPRAEDRRKPGAPQAYGGRHGVPAPPPPPRYGNGPGAPPPPSGLLLNPNGTAPLASSSSSSRIPTLGAGGSKISYDLDEAEAATMRQRSTHRSLQFNRPGRHIAAAEEMRREAAMEALKKRIQETARKAGMQDDLTGEEKNLKRPAPPAVEWWDIALLPPDLTYDEVNLVQVDQQQTNGSLVSKGKAKAEIDATPATDRPRPLIEGEGTPIDIYIQHPIPIPAPSSKVKIEPRALMLTKKEQKKLRKQRRAADLEDKRDRIKMGLLPPDPPKVKLSNLMRVLASESVADPTKVEAKVRRDVAARREQHERTNADRKLTDEQRREKIQVKREKEESKGLYTAVFKIRHLVATLHKIKVKRNAEQSGLTGLTIFNPGFVLVIVEGSGKDIKAYKHLMMNRMDWQMGGRTIDVETGVSPVSAEMEGQEGEGQVKMEGGSSADIKPSTNSGQQVLVDLSSNRCDLIFEGAIRERLWPMGFRARRAETDGDAREILGEKMKGYWDLARRLGASGVKEEEDV